MSNFEGIGGRNQTYLENCSQVRFAFIFQGEIEENTVTHIIDVLEVVWIELTEFRAKFIGATIFNHAIEPLC